jgi:hypothetical protein
MKGVLCMNKRGLNGVYTVNPESIEVRELLGQALALLRSSHAHGLSHQEIAELETEVGDLEIHPEPSSKRNYIMRPDHRLLGRAAHLLEKAGQIERRSDMMELATRLRYAHMNLETANARVVRLGPR